MNYRQALLTIAANACCGPCREAALVAQEALDSPPPLELPDDFIESVGRLCDEARMSGGVAGRDERLCGALDRVEAMIQAIRDPDWQAGARGAFRTPSNGVIRCARCGSPDVYIDSGTPSANGELPSSAPLKDQP